ncbi:histidine kinase [Streptosporangium sp. DT93]|uniref:sensor histidine kinase n=1 Tax=Streptosporangium sp. DT93 TaxID=3393428 RepID=UPI003CF4F2A4
MSTPWEAMTSGPRRFLLSLWPLRCLAYLASGAVTGAVALVVVVVLGTSGVLLSVVVAGIAILAALVRLTGPYAVLERARLRLVDARRAPPSGRWRVLGYGLLAATVLWPVELGVSVATVLLAASTLFGPVVVLVLPPASVPAGLRLGDWIWLTPPIGVVVTIGSAYVLAAVAGARAAIARRFLTSGDAGRLVEIQRSRSRLVEGFEAERRRIERDLHDGVQQSLLALSMRLGLLRMRLGDDAEVGALHEESRRALRQLREVVQGIHPHVLTDRGIGAAVDELAAQSPLPLRSRVRLPGRLPAAVEGAVYFTVSEALANAAKHSGAREVEVTVGLAGGLLEVTITDDGRGGAATGHGTGLQGLADRADALGGRLLVASPAGGPTTLRLEIPCGS